MGRNGNHRRLAPCFCRNLRILADCFVEMNPPSGGLWKSIIDLEGNMPMKLVKCPRCDLNYITETEKFCKVCLREMKGETVKEDVELCSICNEAPALPGKDICLFCLKEMSGDGAEAAKEAADAVSADALADMDSVSTMDEIIPGMEEELEDEEGDEMSLERVREEEEQENEELEEEDGE